MMYTQNTEERERNGSGKNLWNWNLKVVLLLHVAPQAAEMHLKRCPKNMQHVLCCIAVSWDWDSSGADG